jgi:Flp pilus assembly protein TadB
MALSEYEQRVLAQIESELGSEAHKNFVRLRARLLAHWGLIAGVLLALAFVVILAVFAPPPIAASLAAIVGAFAGFRVASRLRRAGR